MVRCDDATADFMQGVDRIGDVYNARNVLQFVGQSVFLSVHRQGEAGGQQLILTKTDLVIPHIAILNLNEQRYGCQYQGNHILEPDKSRAQASSLEGESERTFQNQGRRERSAV